MAKGFNGGIIGTRNLTTGGTSGAATGIYSLNEALTFKLAGLWPQEIGVGQVLTTQIFTESTSWLPPTGVASVDYFMVGGGGGGGSQPGSINAGGGGGGGVLTGSSLSVTPGTTYTIQVGSGGAVNSNGSNSVIYTGATYLTANAVGGG